MIWGEDGHLRLSPSQQLGCGHEAPANAHNYVPNSGQATAIMTFLIPAIELRAVWHFEAVNRTDANENEAIYRAWLPPVKLCRPEIVLAN